MQVVEEIAAPIATETSSVARNASGCTNAGKTQAERDLEGRMESGRADPSGCLSPERAPQMPAPGLLPPAKASPRQLRLTTDGSTSGNASPKARSKGDALRRTADQAASQHKSVSQARNAAVDQAASPHTSMGGLRDVDTDNKAASLLKSEAGPAAFQTASEPGRRKPGRPCLGSPPHQQDVHERRKTSCQRSIDDRLARMFWTPPIVSESCSGRDVSAHGAI